jgi:DeoR/GlpR family transcriptional regulator of sugar metabolism
VTVPALVRLFNASSDAIRSDLHELNAKGHIIRTHGGASSKPRRDLSRIPRKNGI